MNNLKYVEALNFKGFTLEMLVTSCVLAGCDYLKSIKGIGFKTAQKLVAEN
jgi:exonuclease 1